MKRICFILVLLMGSRFTFAQSGSLFVKKTLEVQLLQKQYLSETQNSNQTNQYTSFAGGFSFESKAQTQWPFGGHFLGMISVDGSEQAYLAAPELYMGVRSLEEQGLGIIIGRKKLQWSQFNEDWRLGIWQPQIRWDYLRPVEQGLTGFFASVRGHDFNITGFISPLTLPDQGPNFHLVNGEFVSSNRWFRQPQSRHMVLQQDRPVSYELVNPKISDILFNSGMGLNIVLGHMENGFWLNTSMANKPMNQIHLGIEGYHSVSSDRFMESVAVIHPMVARHSVVTVESGFSSDDFRGWISYTEEKPEKPTLPSGWSQSALSNAKFYGASVSHRLPWLGWKNQWAKLGYMYLSESRVSMISSASSSGGIGDDTFESSFDRYPYRQVVSLGWQGSLLEQFSQRINFKLNYLYSIPERGSLFSAELEYSLNKNTKWNLGMDILGVETDGSQRGLMGLYQNNDRITGGLSYIF
ncbi:MAG: hypothetical protein K1X29_07185 [Bdellovibrionales bacterium]|nr:hypothetical protein [Bdellovibrionales bacterium]